MRWLGMVVLVVGLAGVMLLQHRMAPPAGVSVLTYPEGGPPGAVGQLLLQPTYTPEGDPKLHIEWLGEPVDSITTECLGDSPCHLPREPGLYEVHILLWLNGRVWSDVERHVSLVEGPLPWEPRRGS